MKNLIWLASYPKSGNTMLRLFLASYFFTDDGNFKNFSVLKHIVTLNKIEILFRFKNHLDIIKRLKSNPSLISEYWKPIQDNLIAKEKNKIFFMKTHNANITYKNNAFTNNQFTKCFVYIVRDPRSVLLSMMNHYNFNSFDEAKKYLMSDKAITTVHRNLLPEIMLSWKSNYLSWKNFLNKNNNIGIIVKYEDMVLRSELTFFNILKFICEKNSLNINKNKFSNSLESINFNKLSKMENTSHFPESVRSNQKFFRKGIVDEWQDILPESIVTEIENKYEDVLTQLKYI